MVTRAISRIPGEIREHLENVLISVQQRPSRTLLASMGLPPQTTLLGMYQGVSLDKRSVMAPPLFPDTIVLFQESLEDSCATIEAMEKQIEKTVVHEVAHYFGISEERLAELGYG